MITFKEKPDSSQEIKELLHPYLRTWFFQKFKDFSLPQQYAVLEVHKRNNILISAPTGSGKTLTSFLSILNELIDSADKGILENKTYCVYVSPLKALNNDIQKNLLEPLKEIEQIAQKSLGIRVAVRTGDTTQAEKAKMLTQVPHILITTPESLAILLSSLKFKEHLKNVSWVIIDEVHALAENKRGVHLSLSLERLHHFSPALCRIGLSATINPLEEIAKYVAGTKRNCTVVDIRFLKNFDLQVLSPLSDLINCSYTQLSDETYKIIDELIHEHKTTLIFTNTRSATERVVHHLKTKFPSKYTELLKDEPTQMKSLIGAHHSSLSKEHRLSIEEALRNGKLKAIVCSSSLELGIDIGFIDLVICLGSPKSVVRAMQRLGRSGHQLHSIVKGRVIVLDRDDLVECSVLLKCALEKKIDNIHIPTNALDVLAQQIHGMAVEQIWNENQLYEIITHSYCYKDLSRSDFNEVLSYLAGEYVTLEDRYVYAKIWRENGNIGKKGKLGRVIYMTNIGTIPDESYITVKIGDKPLGHIDEGFLEKLKRGDIFVLGGETYEFQFARGMVAQVKSGLGRKPTIPSWYSETLPLSFDLALEIQRLRKLLDEKFKAKQSKNQIIDFLKEFLFVSDTAAQALYTYFKEQYNYIGLPHLNKIIIENYTDEEDKRFIVFHTLFGRRVNDVLSRAVAFAISKTQHRDVEIGISDNGFYVSSEKFINPAHALKLIKSKDLRKILEAALDKSEVLRRRFRHCATRAMMILRTYKGQTKRVGKQQVSSMLLLNAVRGISDNFCILKEAKREVLEDLMDITSATAVIKAVEENKIRIEELYTLVPSPFATQLILQGYSDTLKVEERQAFLQRMHTQVLAKISLKKIKA